MNLLPSIGVIQAPEPSTYLLTPFQDGVKTYLAFLAQAQKSIRMMIYSFTLAQATDDLIAAKGRGLDIGCIFDYSQSRGKYEKAQLQRLVDAGFVDGKDFVVGTSPKSHAICHLKAAWIDGTHVLSGSWNFSNSATSEYNDICITTSPELAAAYQRAYDFGWQWILSNEKAYQTL